MKNNQKNDITYTAKDFYKRQNRWTEMLNFDSSPKGSNTATMIGAVWGWIYYLWFQIDLSQFTWEYLIRGVEGVGMAVMCAFATKVTNDFYTTKLKHKLFKNGKSKKNKEADKTDEKAA